MDDDELIDDEQSDKQSKTDHLRPWQYKKGQSGNPHGRPVGAKSMKTYLKERFEGMTDDERETFLEGIDKKVLFEMAEGKAAQDSTLALKGNVVLTFDPAFNPNLETPQPPTSGSIEQGAV